MEPVNPRILVVEDEKPIRHFVRLALSNQHWQVFETATGRQGLAELALRQPHAVILDLGLPDIDGVDFIREVRAWSPTPILVLSARGEDADKIAALDAGADDYLTKPFSVGELLARLRVMLRRLPEGGTASADKIRFGEVEVNLADRLVTKIGKPIHLTPIEYRLLVYLVAHEGKVITHRQLMREIWGPAYVDRGHYLRIYMGHLRHKLEDDPARPRYLLTETAIGYRFTNPA